MRIQRVCVCVCVSVYVTSAKSASLPQVILNNDILMKRIAKFVATRYRYLFRRR